MKNKKVAIIIVNWNGKKFIKDCLNAVFKQTHKKFKVYLVDNGSTDGSSDFVNKIFPQTKIIQLDKNYGFAKGNNVGIKEAFKDKSIKYIVCLNNDTIVDKNWLKEMVKTAGSNNKIGAVGSVSLYPNKTIQNAGIRLLKSKTFNEDYLGAMSIGYGKPSNHFKRDFKIFAPSGVSALYKREMLEELGLFDEDFFSYCEDIDMGFRIKLSKWSCFCSARSKLIHFHSQTTGLGSPFKAYYSKRNGYFLAMKYFSFLDIVLFPFRDIIWNFRNLFKKSKLNSVNKLKKNMGFLGLFWIMLRIYLSVLFYASKMLFKIWNN